MVLDYRIALKCNLFVKFSQVSSFSLVGPISAMLSLPYLAEPLSKADGGALIFCSHGVGTLFMGGGRDAISHYPGDFKFNTSILVYQH
jgi:hypothetical protein